MTIAAFELKQGATFFASSEYEDPVSGATDITSITITSAVERGADKFPLTIVKTNAALGQFSMSADTSTWPLGLYRWDIRFSVGGVVSYSSTVTFKLVDAIT